jgi:hypothetical protein
VRYLFACDIHWTVTLVSQTYLRVVQKMAQKLIEVNSYYVSETKQLHKNVTLDQTFHCVSVFV